MNKITYGIKEVWKLIKKYKLWFLAPTLIFLIIISILVFTIGPAVIVSFLYAGV